MEEHQSADWSVFHTAEEMQRLSDLGHRIEGILLAAVALIALCEATGVLKNRYVWPSLIVIAGLFLIGFLLLHHGLENFKLVLKLILSDGQQRQHLLMAALLTLAGISEIFFRAKGIGVLQYVWPVAIGIIGLMFLIHEQHGSSEAVEWATKIHRYLGILLVLVAACIFLNIFLSPGKAWLGYLWPVLLLMTSVFLFIYKEPKGAYQDGKKDNSHDMNH